MNDVESEYQNAVLARRNAETAFNAIPKTDLDALEAARGVVELAVDRVYKAQEAVKSERILRGCSGLNSPLAQACRDHLDPEMVSKLEAAALEIQREIDRSSPFCATMKK